MSRIYDGGFFVKIVKGFFRKKVLTQITEAIQNTLLIIQILGQLTRAANNLADIFLDKLLLKSRKFTN